MNPVFTGVWGGSGDLLTLTAVLYSMGGKRQPYIPYDLATRVLAVPTPSLGQRSRGTAHTPPTEEKIFPVSKSTESPCKVWPPPRGAQTPELEASETFWTREIRNARIPTHPCAQPLDFQRPNPDILRRRSIRELHANLKGRAGPSQGLTPPTRAPIAACPGRRALLRPNESG